MPTLPNLLLRATGISTHAATSVSGWWTLGAAFVAAAAAVAAAVLARRSGKESSNAQREANAINARATEAAHKAADAASESAAAAYRSAEAAEENVSVNAAIAEAAGKRADAAALAQRYQDAAAQLGHAKAPVRLAGVYAMANLADDWLEQRQTCINVLCAYLGLPWPPSSEQEEQRVRVAIQQVIRSRLQATSTDNWSSQQFDFAHAELRGLDFRGATFNTRPNFANAVFKEWCSFEGAVFNDGFVLSRAVIECLFILEPGRLAGPPNLRRVVIAPAGKLRFYDLALQCDRMFMDDLIVQGTLDMRLSTAAAVDSYCDIAINELKATDGTVNISADSEPRPQGTIFLSALGWRVLGTSSIVLRARNGRGKRPASVRASNWPLNTQGLSEEEVRATDMWASGTAPLQSWRDK